MLKQLRRWLGWDSDSSPFDFGRTEIPPRAERPKVEPQPAPAKDRAPLAPSQRASRPAKPPATKAVPQDVIDSPRVLDILDDPKLTLDHTKDDSFDPYNTGAFNRSASWEKISRKR